MESTTETIQQPGDLAPGRTLQVDFSWRKFKSLITEKDDPDSKPVYIVDYKTFSPHLVFRLGADDSTLGTGTLHPISINADCDIRGRHITLKAMKRFKTSYMHLSPAFSDTKEPVPLIWTSDCDFKTWDFICMDENQLPVAKFSANIWALKKVGNIEFVGKAATSKDIQDEILVTGLTLFYCMALRSNNILSLFGAIFSRPGNDADVKNLKAVGLELSERRSEDRDGKTHVA